MNTDIIKWVTIAVAVFVFTAPVSAASWMDQAKTEFEKDRYEDVIETAQDHKKDKKCKIGLMLLAFSHLQLHEFNGTKTDKKRFRNYMDLLEDRVSAVNLNEIYYFVRQADKPEVVKQARALLKHAFKGVFEIEDIQKLLPFVKVKDLKTRKMALSAIDDIIEIKRKYVNKGGTLRRKDVGVMRGQGVIRALLDNISQSAAFSALVDIEQPVLAYTKDYDGKKVMKLEVKINRAISKREKKYPKSNWYSATGKILP